MVVIMYDNRVARQYFNEKIISFTTSILLECGR
jgi:hypothetical protein